MSEANKMTLIEKLAEIYKSVGYLHKKESNDFQHFKYVSSAQVITEIRGKMCELGVLLEPSVTAHNLMHFQNAKGVEQLVTEIDMQYTWINVDDPKDVRVVNWYAQGKDSDEKGVGKAMTYGEKFFLLKYFNIATDKHDPDAQAKQDSAKVKKPTPKERFLVVCKKHEEILGKDKYDIILDAYKVKDASEVGDTKVMSAIVADLKANAKESK